MEMSPSPSPAKGKLYVVGTGPGSPEHLTAAAVNAIEEAEYVIGNKLYLDMLAPMLDGKKVIASGMGGEVARAGRSLELAEGATVAIVSGGDAGVYGMAGIVFEVAEKSGSTVDIAVLPGVTAATAAAALLGAPLSGDFVVISLSDLLTPWETICRRLELAFSMGVPVAIYNPRSRGRPHNFSEALGIALKTRRPDTPVGIIKNAYRDGEQVIVTTLAAISADHEAVDMHSAVIVGGEESRIWRSMNGERIVTPRGYHRKYEL